MGWVKSRGVEFFSIFFSDVIPFFRCRPFSPMSSPFWRVLETSPVFCLKWRLHLRCWYRGCEPCKACLIEIPWDNNDFFYSNVGCKATSIVVESMCQSIPPGKDRWLATPISLGLSWPLTKSPFGSCAIYFHYGVTLPTTLPTTLSSVLRFA